MIRQSQVIAVVGAFLIAGVAVGCANAQGNIDDERGGEEGADTTNEETTEPARLDAEVVSPLGEANVPAGFGEASLWATAAFGPGTDCGYDCVAGSMSGEREKTNLKRVDPQTGEVVAVIPLDGVAWVGQVAGGAGSVWVSNGEDSDEPRPERNSWDLVFRVDPQTNRVVDRIPVDSPSGLDFGFGSVWVTSGSYGTLSRIDPQTGEVVAKIDVGRGAVDVAVDENSGAVWVAGMSGSGHKPEQKKLTRVDPATNRVVAEIPIRAGASNVAVGEGAVWVSSGGYADTRLVKVNPETNEVAGIVSVGGYADTRLVVYGGGVWAMVDDAAGEIRLVRIDPSTMHVVAYKNLKPFDIVAGAPGLAGGGGYVWFSSGKGLARVAP